MEYRYEKIFNALLDIASDEAMLRGINAIPTCDELDNTYMPSESMDNKIRRIISRIEHSKRAKAIIKTEGRKAVRFILLLIISVMILLSVQASRNYIFITFIDWFDDLASFEFKESDPISLYDKYSLNYIPTDLNS